MRVSDTPDAYDRWVTVTLSNFDDETVYKLNIQLNRKVGGEVKHRITALVEALTSHNRSRSSSCTWHHQVESRDQN